MSTTNQSEDQYLKDLPTGGDMPVMKITPERFVVVTWNVWKGKFCIQSRWQSVVEIVLSVKPHVICFQEVTKDFISLIDSLRDRSSSSGLSGMHEYSGLHSSDNRISPPDPDNSSGGKDYGVLILTHISLGKPHRMQVTLNTKFNRWLDIVSWAVRADSPDSSVNARRFTVATVHLESAKHNFMRRICQLGQIFDCMRKCEFSAPDNVVILCGDFNFCPEMKREQACLERETTFVDLWPHLYDESADPGYTEDTKRNIMRLEQSGEEKQVRFDRVIVHGISERVIAHELRLLGTSELPIQLCPRSPLCSRRDSEEEIRFATSVFPSDHFGIVAEMSIR